tara:strand:- start:6753 stop:7508 length:756 start_codon:yes stop_codon:yes gene_type:complete
MHTKSKSGFTLLEMIIVMSLIAVLAGAILPAAGSIMRSQSRRSTIEEMDLMSEAVQEFYRDTRQFPTGPLDLLGGATPGWSGPYLRGVVDDPWSSQSGYAVDGFGNPYTFTANGFEMTITSDGADRTNGTADDIELVVNVTPMLRQMTRDELRVINTAIAQYNAAFLGTDPLSGNYGIAVSQLENAGYLPTGSDYDADEWGDDYTGNPANASPMTEAMSINVGAGAGAGGNNGNGNNGNGNGNNGNNGNGN